MATDSTPNAPLEKAGPNDVKVMIVDDSKTIRRTAELLLKKAGYHVITAPDGFEALAAVARYHPDIIFIDIMMPKLDGYQTCSLIKNNKSYKKIPIVMLSSKDGIFDRAKSRVSGSDDYLTKPFTREELLNVIRSRITNSAQQRTHS